MQADGLEDGLDVGVAVRPLPKDVEIEIDFGERMNDQVASLPMAQAKKKSAGATDAHGGLKRKLRYFFLPEGFEGFFVAFGVLAAMCLLHSGSPNGIP